MRTGLGMYSGDMQGIRGGKGGLEGEDTNLEWGALAQNGGIKTFGGIGGILVKGAGGPRQKGNWGGDGEQGESGGAKRNKISTLWCLVALNCSCEPQKDMLIN